ncbi:hypothetical protein ACWDZ6_28725 [Streptomyces sp. NPDC002926]
MAAGVVAVFGFDELQFDGALSQQDLACRLSLVLRLRVGLLRGVGEVRAPGP